MESITPQKSTSFWVGAWDGGWALLSLLATLAGAWAAGALATEDGLSRLALALTLPLAGWRPLWNALVTVNWAAPLRAWRDWDHTLSAPRLPYTQPDTPGARLAAALGRARSWWAALGAEALALPLRSAALALAISLLLSAALGRTALLLTFCCAACAQLAALWGEGRGEPVVGWEALALASLPWLLGASLSVQPLPLGPAALLAVLVGAYARPGVGAALGPMLMGAYLVWQGQALAAGALLLLAFPALLLSIYRAPFPCYRRAAAPWLLAMLATLALAL